MAPMSKTYKYVLTFSLFFCYFAYGVNFYVVGPTLVELAGLFQTTIERISLIYTVRSAGYTFGSLGGFVFKYINRQLTFVFFLTLMGVTLAVMPHCANLTQLLILAGINGFSIGSFDTAINVWILEIWAESSGPFMQALHFTYGIGSFVAPLICEPFLSSDTVHTGGHGIPQGLEMPTSTPSSVAPYTSLLSSTVAPSTEAAMTALAANITNLTGGVPEAQLPSIDPIDFLIYIPYSIAGAITMFSSVLVLVLYYYKKYEPPVSAAKIRKQAEAQALKASEGTGIESSHHQQEISWRQYIKRKSPPCLTLWLVTMGSLFLTFFVGMEQMHLQFLPTFAVSTELDISPSTAAMMSSAAALAFTVGRGLSIPLAIMLRPQTILYSNHVLMLAGTFILAIYANSSVTMLWVGNCILGLGFSSVYASIYAFLENQIRVTNRIGSVFVFAGGLTAALSPSLVGQYIEATPLILVWFNLVCCLLCLTLLVIIHLTVHLSMRRPAKKFVECEKSGNGAREDLLEKQTEMVNFGHGGANQNNATDRPVEPA